MNLPFMKKEVINIGTNYYMMTTNKELVEKHFPYEYEIVDTPYFGYEIHIGKQSAGWCPLFQEHKNAYDSVAEMKEFIRSHSEDIRIFDEYCREFTLEQLEDELINWGKQQEIRYMKYIPEGVPDTIFGGKEYLIKSTKDDYDITIPFDHIEYEKLNPYKEHWIYKNESYYFKDKDGYDFTKGDFC